MDFLSLKEILPEENTLSFMFMSVNRNLLEWLLKVTLEWKERKYQNYCPIRNNYERWSEVMVMRGSDNKSEVKEKPVDFQEENGQKGWTGENEGMLLEKKNRVLIGYCAKHNWQHETWLSLWTDITSSQLFPSAPEKKEMKKPSLLWWSIGPCGWQRWEDCLCQQMHFIRPLDWKWTLNISPSLNQKYEFFLFFFTAWNSLPQLDFFFS